MADLLYANYLHQFERSERIVLPRNPFDDYDEKNSKRDSDCPSLVAVSKLLEQVNDGNCLFTFFLTPPVPPFRCVIAITIGTVNIEVLNSIRDVFVRLSVVHSV